MIELNTEQFEELSQFLGHDPELEGRWAIIPSTRLTYCINSKGTHVIRLASKDCRGYLHKTRRNSFIQDLGGYLMCNIDNVPHKLHRLMAEIWLDDYNESLTVNHKDGNKHNNDYHNLEMLTVHDNCMHYHNSSAMEEKRLRDYAYHGTTIKGRIHITNGIDSRMIYESEGIPDGWWKGRPNQLNTNCLYQIRGKRHIIAVNI